jgi:RNA polymerase sigma factor (sigma-70 family)
MSPRSVRRYRAERLLRREFDATRGPVLAAVRRRLRSVGVKLDDGDLEACYAQAWHGLYTTMLAGEVEIASTVAWLTLVTYRRALDEHRGRTRACGSDKLDLCERRAVHDLDSAPDPADGLDHRARLRQLLEGLRGRLGPRERQAAALCFLHGLSRADAAAQMGISQARMRKLMDGSRAGSPGVASKVGELLQAILAGSFCAEQTSLMRALAFGILDPEGERYMLAHAHSRECPACRAYVLALRGLAAVLPPLPLPLVLGAGVAAGAGAGATSGAGAGAASSGGATAGAASSGGATATSGTAGGIGAAGSASAAGSVGAAGGAAGVGVTGGGWLLAGGGLGAKLVAGCLVAVTVGFGCAALTIGPPARAHPIRRGLTRRPRRSDATADSAQALGPTVAPTGATGSPSTWPAGSVSRTAPASATAGVPSGATQASREFGLEQPAASASAQAGGSAASVQTGRSANAQTASMSHTSAGRSREHPRRPRASSGRRAGARPEAGADSPAGAWSASAADSGSASAEAGEAPGAGGTSPGSPSSTGQGAGPESAAANDGPPSAAEREFGI